jgi:mono/diheme cytochrome c family protein
MLLTRQFIQQQKVLPLLSQAQANAAEYRKIVDEYVPQSLAGFSGKLTTVYDNGQTIFNNSCSFCHGLDGSGNSLGSTRLLIPPERIAQSRSSREWIYYILVNGYPGTGMPYFSVFDKYKLESLMDHLDDRFHIFHATETLPVTITEQEQKTAQREFNTLCSQCHGIDGRGKTAYSKYLSPSPPDFVQYNLTPARVFEVIRDGYPGTAMKSFEPLPEKVRWGLVQKVNSFRGNPK